MEETSQTQSCRLSKRRAFPVRGTLSLLLLGSCLLAGGCFTQHTRSTPLLMGDVAVPSVQTPKDKPAPPPQPEIPPMPLPKYVPGTYIHPLPQGILSSPFGIRLHPILHDFRMHDGIDIAAKEGTPIVASAPGKVIAAGDTNNGYGIHVDIRHGSGIVTRYAHMSAVLVNKDDTVLAGMPIGLVGNTGLSTGPHTHFEVRMRGEPVDPLPLLTNGKTTSAMLLPPIKPKEPEPVPETRPGNTLKNALMLFKESGKFFF